MLEVQNVSKSYGSTRAVREVAFTLAKGEVVGLLGPNGAGKTTTIRMITGAHPPDAGRVRVLGHDTMTESLLARKHVGWLSESAPLYLEMTPVGYLDFRGKLYGMGRAARKAAIEHELTRCRLKDVSTKRIAHLSKGYRQRVGLAAALLHKPEVVILDEPTNGLDPAQIVQIREVIREVSATATMLLSSHVLSEVDAVCGRVIIMAAGRVRADGTPARLREMHAGAASYVVEAGSQIAKWSNGQMAKSEGNDTPGDAPGNTPGNTPGATPGVADGAVLSMLARIPGVAAVTPMVDVSGPGAGPGAAEGSRRFVSFRVTAMSNAGDLREPIAAAALAAGVLVRELRREVPTLEQVFARLTVGAETINTIPAAAAANPPTATTTTGRS
jgi:ABC-2 type transport system ATP-binding protein